MNKELPKCSICGKQIKDYGDWRVTQAGKDNKEDWCSDCFLNKYYRKRNDKKIQSKTI